MGRERTDLLRGTLDLLILKALALEPLHGVGVSRRITQITAGAFRVSFGSLFPALHRSEEKGWVEAEWARLGEQSPGQVLPPDFLRSGTAQGRGNGIGARWLRS